MAANLPVFRERMNPTDALFWAMDAIPDLRSTIGALIVLERAPSRQALRRDFARLSETMPRLRQRVVEVPFGLAPPEWIDDDQFDLDYHLRFVAVPEPARLEEALEEIGPFYSEAFDRERPLWEAYILEGLVGGRGALFMKMHHCMTDGVGGTQLSQLLMSGQPDGRPPLVPRATERRSTDPAALLWRALLHNAGEAAMAAASVVRGALGAAMEPARVLEDLGQAAQATRGFARQLFVTRADSPLHARRSLSRRLSTFTMPMAKIDAARARFGATNNDVVLTIVSGALRRWHSLHHHEVAELRALVPVNLRQADDTTAGNRIALLAVGLPVGERHPLRRLRRIQEHMGRVKVDRRASLYPIVARVMIALPAIAAEGLARQQMTRANFVCTNVPGPRQTQFLAGVPIEAIYAYAPLVGDHPLAIALLSYRGTMFVGLDVDSLAMDDLPRFREALREAYEEVVNFGARIEARPARAPRRGRHPVREVAPPRRRAGRSRSARPK